MTVIIDPLHEFPNGDILYRALVLGAVALPIKASQMKMLLATYKTHVAVDTLIIIHSTEILTCATVLGETCDWHALATLVFQRLLVVIQKLLPLNCCFSYAVDEALTVGAHEMIPSPLVLRGRVGLRLKPYTDLPPLLNSYFFLTAKLQTPHPNG